MVPDFALFLSPEGIALAHRQPAGHWAVLGDTALDVPDLGAELIRLRKLAEQRGGEGFETLLILPDDQILYTSLTAPGPSDEDRTAQIASGLEGLTPYAVEELKYDFLVIDDGRVKLAVIAEETLDEATEFAKEHGFNVAGFGARPLDNRYPGVAHFDRSLEWTSELETIGFGPDSWHNSRSGPTTQTNEPDEVDADPTVEAELEAPEAVEDRETEDASADDIAAEVAADSPDDPEPEPTPEAANDAPDDAPVAGFVSRRAHDAPPETAGERLGTRSARFGLAADASAEDAPASDVPDASETPDEPAKLKRKPRGNAKAAPKLSRKKAGTNADGDGEPAAPRKKPAKPSRPAAAGPAPELPPLARVKKQVEKGPDFTKAAPPDEPPERPVGAGPEPEPPRSSTSGMRDRLAAAGRKFSAASALRKSGPDAIESSTDSATETDPDQSQDPDVSTDEPRNSDKKKRSRLSGLASGLSRGKKKDKSADPEKTKQLAAALSAKPATEAEKPAERKRFTSPKRNKAKAPAPIDDADAPIMGGLLARDSVASQNGPSLRTGLILTLILVAIMGLVAFWTMFYLPETALGRWLGIGTQEEEQFVLAGAEPDIGAGSGFAEAPSAEDAPIELSSLAPDVMPETPMIAAPDLLPGIDDDLDLEPLPVTPTAIDPETVLPSPEENESFYARTGIWQRPPVITLPDPNPQLQEVIFAGLDQVISSHDAILLATPDFLPSADLPNADNTAHVERLTVEDLVVPSPEGTIAPYGAVVFAGPPPIVPRQRPIEPTVLPEAATGTGEALAEILPDAEGVIAPGAVDTALLAAFRPETRPGDLQEQYERAVLGGITFQELGGIRPATRPQSVQELAVVESGVDLTPGDASGASELAIPVSMVPPSRPSNIAALVAAAEAAGNSGPVPPVAANQSDTVQPQIPTSASVTRAATEENAINLRRINLIGVSGAASNRRALVRMPSGRFVTVEVGDRLDGGRVAAIGEDALQYVKSGRTITLEVPTG